MTDSITEINEDSILTGKKRYLVDVIIYATGFQPTESICSFQTNGKNGSDLYHQVGFVLIGLYHPQSNPLDGGSITSYKFICLILKKQL